MNIHIKAALILASYIISAIGSLVLIIYIIAQPFSVFGVIFIIIVLIVLGLHLLATLVCQYLRILEELKK